MISVDFNNELNKYLHDKKRKIPKAHLESVCLLYKGEKACRYISLVSDGFICVKHTSIKDKLTEMANNNKMTAKSDNCEGFGKLC